jgi:serine phosphatase RsbU (regulator of sigma subunit)
MIKVGVGQGECIDTLNATRMAIARCKQQLGGLSPQAGIVFAGTDFNHQQMLEEIHRSFPNIELAGCTTSGEFSSDYGFSDDSVSLMVFYSDTIEIKAGMGTELSKNPGSAARKALQQASAEISQPVSLCLIFPSSYIESPNRIVETLNHELGTDCPIFGGSAGCQMYSGEQQIQQFFKTEVLQDALPMLVFAGSLEYAFSVNNSWEPVGKKAVVTQAKGREVMRIGDMNALDFYHYYLGKHTYPAMEFPLAVYEADGGDFYLRGITSYNPANGSVSFLETIPEGATVQLTESIRDNLIEGTKQSLESLQTCLVTKSQSRNTATEAGKCIYPVFALGFSCALRKYILGTRTPEELKLLKNHLPGHLPVMGFYGFGEFSPLRRHHSSRFHNATLVTLVVGTADRNEIPASVTPASRVSVKEELLTEYQLQRKNRFLQKKLRHSELYREQLESNKELNAALLRKINQEIEDARQEIALANKKIMDSIRYAERIQESLLPNLDEITARIPNRFFLWMPRDVVSGDIYFTDCFEDGFIIAVIDCTGHGVPGAFMTMIAVSALRRIVRDENCHDPAEILTRLNYSVTKTLQQDKDYAVSDDGLDIGICFVSCKPDAQFSNPNYLPSVLTFAGAKLPLYYLRNDELTVLRGDRQSIGYKFSDLDSSFTNHRIPIETGMRFYMATDGFADQIGEKEGRRFGTRALKNLLKDIGGKPFEKQKDLLVQAFEEHRGKNERQDDVTVAGFGF